MWNKTSPSGIDRIKFGDDNLREMKVDITNAFNTEHHFPIDPLNPQLIHKIPYGTTSARPSASGN